MKLRNLCCSGSPGFWMAYKLPHSQEDTHTHSLHTERTVAQTQNTSPEICVMTRLCRLFFCFPQEYDMIKSGRKLFVGTLNVQPPPQKNNKKTRFGASDWEFESKVRTVYGKSCALPPLLLSSNVALKPQRVTTRTSGAAAPLLCWTSPG